MCISRERMHAFVPVSQAIGTTKYDRHDIWQQNAAVIEDEPQQGLVQGPNQPRAIRGAGGEWAHCQGRLLLGETREVLLVRSGRQLQSKGTATVSEQESSRESTQAAHRGRGDAASVPRSHAVPSSWQRSSAAAPRRHAPRALSRPACHGP